MTKEELDQYRSDAQGCTHVIHFNNAGASLQPDVVADTVMGY